MTNLEVANRATTLGLLMDPIARDVRMASRSDQLMEPGAVARVSNMLRDSFTLDALDVVSQDVAHFLQRKRAAQTMDACLVKFGLLGRNAESRMQLGGAFPRASVSVLSPKDASLSLADTQPVLASAQEKSGIAEAARQMRGLFGPMGKRGRHDVLSATSGKGKLKSPSGAEEFEASVAHHKTENNSAKEEKRGGQNKNAGKEKGGREKLNGIYARPGRRTRCYLSDSGYHLLPKRPPPARQ